MENRQQYKPYFHEQQRCADSPVKWIYPLFFLVGIGPLGIAVYGQLTSVRSYSFPPSPGFILFFAITFVLLGFFWITYLRSYLEVTVDAEGIHYRFPVFIRKWHVIKKEEIARYELRKFLPIMEYGGFLVCGRRGNGLHHNRGFAYAVSGKTGLQLYFVNHKRVLFGTRRPDALARAMKKMMDECEHPHDNEEAIHLPGRKRGSRLTDKG